MAIKPIISVSGIGVRVVTAEVITSSCVIVVDEIWMHVVDSIIHYGCCDVLPVIPRAQAAATFRSSLGFPPFCPVFLRYH